MRRTRKGTSTASTWRAKDLSRGAFLEMLSAFLALYYGQSSYNPGKVGWFGNLGRRQSSDNPRKVGWFGFIGGLYDVVPNVEMRSRSPTDVLGGMGLSFL